MLGRTCPVCGHGFRKALRPKNAVGAAAYMYFCPGCRRELVYGPGVKVRVALIGLIVAAWLGGLFDAFGATVGTVLRVLAGAALLAAWFFLPVYTAGPRRYNEDTGLAEDAGLAEKTGLAEKAPDDES